MRPIVHFFYAALLGLNLTACSSREAPAASDNSLTATTPASSQASTVVERNANNRLKETLGQNLSKAGIKASISSVRATEIPNLYWVSLDGMPPVYATADAKYIIQGDVVRLDHDNVVNISDELNEANNKVLFEHINLKDTITYPAKGKTRAVVYVFTDSSCPYCHKLHAELDDITAKGIEVRYLAWPRGAQFLPTMNAIWCSPDRAAAFSMAVKGLPVTAPACKNAVLEQRQLGMQIGVDGTPAIYSSNGKYIGGFMSAQELANKLGL